MAIAKVFGFCFLLFSAAAGNECSAEDGTCQDSSALLQSRVETTRSNGGPDSEALSMAGACNKQDGGNCCFTEKGATFGLQKHALAKGTKAGMCAAEVFEIYPDLWGGFVDAGYVTQCAADECVNPNIEALEPELGKGSASGKCGDYKCSGVFVAKKNPVKDAPCTNEDECEFNCCDVDVNARKGEKTSILTLATIMVLKNATEVSGDLDVEAGDKTIEKGHDFAKDVQALKDSFAGLARVMSQIPEGAKACPSGDVSHLKSCVHKAVCIIEDGVDPSGMDEDDLKTYTLLVELYDKFADITWDKMNSVLLQEGAKLKNFDFVSPEELACDGLGGLKEKISSAFMETDEEEQQATYRVSAALVDAAKTTHAVLDAHMANSSVDETVAALHRAWQVPCEMLDCDHTNYWDLLGASHRHSLALIESGASARHMRVHVGVRSRLEHRMQVFLGTAGNLFADRIIRTEGTKTEVLAQTYTDRLFEAARNMWTEHPKKYGVDHLFLSLLSREQVHEHAKTDFQKQALQAVMDDTLIAASKKATLYKIMEERGTAVTDETDEDEDSHEDSVYIEDDAVSDMPDEDEDAVSDMADMSEEDHYTLMGRSSVLDRTLTRKGVAKTFKAVGKAIVKHVVKPVVKTVVKVAKAVGKAVVSAVTAVGKAIVTVATAIGSVIKAIVDFVVSLFQCFGFGIVGSIGYTKTFGTYVKLSLSASVSRGLGGILKGPVKDSIGIAVSLGLGIGAQMEIGISVGVGISAGISCGVNSVSGFGCSFSIGVGVSASASVPKEQNPWCPFGATIFSTFKCSQSYGMTMKIMCCSIDLITGCSSCGSGGCGKKDAAANKKVANAVASGGKGSISCDEALSGNGAGYRGCQDKTKSGRRCQKWSAQNPHKHGQCKQTTQKFKGKNMKVWCENSGDEKKGLGDHMLCRNPDGHSTIWCYTTDSKKRWEDCNPLAPQTYVQIKGGVECKSGDNRMGKKSTVEQCADAVLKAGGTYFIFGTGGKAGWCWKENTASKSCPQGWQTDQYNFYTTEVTAEGTLPLAGSWKGYGGSYKSPLYSVQNGVCAVEGLLRYGGWGHLATLPAGCRPTKRLIFNMNNHASTSRVDVETNGKIRWVSGGKSHRWISLGGLNFATSGGSSLSMRRRWKGYGGSYGSPTYKKTNGMCIVQGLAKASRRRRGSWGTIAVLPSGCRPNKRLIFNQNNHQYTSRVDVQTNGYITWVAGGRSHNWLSLSGISFAVGGLSTVPLKNRWRGYGGSYGSPQYAVKGGLCVVQGLARYGGWGHIATLPSTCRPDRRVIFNLNNHRSTSRVDVLTNGQVRWVSGGKGHSWISLTGIEFPTR